MRTYPNISASFSRTAAPSFHTSRKVEWRMMLRNVRKRTNEITLSKHEPARRQAPYSIVKTGLGKRHRYPGSTTRRNIGKRGISQFRYAIGNDKSCEVRKIRSLKFSRRIMSVLPPLPYAIPDNARAGVLPLSAPGSPVQQSAGYDGGNKRAVLHLLLRPSRRGMDR